MNSLKKIFGNKKVVSLCLALVLIAAVGVVNYKLTNGMTAGKREAKEVSADAEAAGGCFFTVQK